MEQQLASRVHIQIWSNGNFSLPSSATIYISEQIPLEVAMKKLG